MEVLYLGSEASLAYVRAHLPAPFSVRLALDDESVREALSECDVVLDAYMKVRFTAAAIEAAKNLKLFVTASTGADHIEAEALQRRQIPLLTLEGQRELLWNITAAAEHSWLLLMACARQLPDAVQEVHRGGWERNRFPGIMLRGKTLGLIGCGRIGQWMAKYATAFGMRRMGYDPYVAPWPKGIEPSTLEGVLSVSDFVSVHVPLNEETRGLFDRHAFARMKPGSVLVNTSRGDVLDEHTLLLALESGRLAAAGLDVLTGEPDVVDHPLVAYSREHGNLIITPHIGGFSPDALEQVLAFSCRRIKEYFQFRT